MVTNGSKVRDGAGCPQTVLAVALLCSAMAGHDPPASAGVHAATVMATIDTIAGGGSVGDGGPATSARLNLPGGIAEAPNGDLVIVDFGNHRLRRLNRRNGTMAPLAGTGAAGYNGDGIPAVDAQLARPEYAAFDRAGDLFIADSYNNRIRRVDQRTGVMTTVAGTGERGFSGDGGPAANCTLHFPEGLAIDDGGNLFIADTVNRRIRRVDAATGIIDTYAGIGEIGVNAEGTPALEARFLRLARIAVDRTGNLYVADSPAHRILIIDGATRHVATFAGTGRSGFAGDGGAATAAQLSFPEGPVVASNGDIYFADVGNHRVRRIDARTRKIATVAGNGEKGFSGDGGPGVSARLWSPGRVWVDRAGDILIADILNARIRAVDGRTGVISTVAGSGEWGDGGLARDAILSVPGDVVHTPGTLYIADYGTRRVRAVDLATGRISTVAGGGTRTAENIPATEFELRLPEGIAADGQRSLYIADNIAGKVLRVDLATGAVRTFAGGGPRRDLDGDVPATSVRLDLPSALAIGPGGLVYIGEFGGRRIRVVDPRTGMMRTLRTGGARRPIDLAVTSIEATARGLFLLVHGTNDVGEFHFERGSLAILHRRRGLPSAPSGDTQLIDIAAHAPALYLADTLAHRVLRLDVRNSAVRVVAGSGVQGFGGDGGPAERAALFQPGGVAVSADGRDLFIADTKNQRIRRVALAPEPGVR